MDDEINNDIKTLKELCIKVIVLFDEIKEKGAIRNEEYEKHTKEKILK